MDWRPEPIQAETQKTEALERRNGLQTHGMRQVRSGIRGGHRRQRNSSNALCCRHGGEGHELPDTGFRNRRRTLMCAGMGCRKREWRL